MHFLLFFGLLLLLSRGFVGKSMQLFVLIAIFCFMNKTNIIAMLLILCVTTVLAISFKILISLPKTSSKEAVSPENALERLVQEEQNNKKAWDEHYKRCRETRNTEG